MAALKPSTLRIGNRYRASRLKGPYDALIIGSGIGGLTTAALLSDLGWKVAVFEQHYTAGGYTHSYERNGYEWDVGVHYIGDMGTTTMSRRFMDYLSGGKLDWAPMDPEYDRFYIGDKVFKAVAGLCPLVNPERKGRPLNSGLVISSDVAQHHASVPTRLRMQEEPFGETTVSKELLLEFFLTFSRFEYALKATGYYKRRPVKPPDWPKAEPDWDRFAASLRKIFNSNANEPREALLESHA